MAELVNRRGCGIRCAAAAYVGRRIHMREKKMREKKASGGVLADCGADHPDKGAEPMMILR